MMWKSVKLGEIANWTRGLTYSKKDEVESDGIAVIRATNINLATHKIVLDEVRLVNNSVKVKEEKYAQVGDLLVCTASGSKAHVGKVAIVEEDLRMAFGGFMAALRCREDCYPRFLYHVLTSQKFKWHLNNLGDGANINNLKFSQIEGFEFPLPPLEEQQRIVAKLDAAFVEIDKAIESAVTKETEVEKLKASLLSSYLDSSALIWDTVKLEDLCTKITDGSHNPPKGVGSSEYLMLSSKNVYNDMISYDKPRFLSKLDFEYENKRTDIQAGDVLLTIVGTIGRCAVFEGLGNRFTLQRSVAVLKPKHDLVLSRFMMYVLQSMLEVLNDGARGVAQKGIYLKALKALSFPLPPLTEQQRIVAKLDTAYGEFENVNDSINKSKVNYLALKSAILAQELQCEVA